MAISAVQPDRGPPPGGTAGRLPCTARLYIASVTGAAVIAVAPGLFAGIRWEQVAVLGLALITCESPAAPLNTRLPSWSASTMASLAAVVLTGPVGAGLVSCCTLFGIRRPPSLAQRLFSTAVLTLSAYLAGRTFLLFGGPVGTPTPHALPGIIEPFAAAAMVHVAVNYALVRCMFRLARETGSTTGRLWPDIKLGLTALGYGTFGLPIAALWAALGPFAALLTLAPVFVARWATLHPAAQQHAYEAMVSALCQAVEIKDFYTRGHCERVSRGSVLIAREIGMRAERVAAIRYAGMLHDVGKLGVPTPVLQKNGTLTDDEYAAIMMHPMYGLDMVRGIGFLGEALAGITHHHERIDGKGYPLGLAGDEIPEFARLLAVADAFDAMTSNRSYRDARSASDAMAELRRCAGTHFDPAFVDAFATAIERDGWTPAEPATMENPGQPDDESSSGHAAGDNQGQASQPETNV